MKYLVRKECDRIKFYRIKKGPRQMVSVGGRLYRIEDSVMSKDILTDNAIIAYDIDDTQPWGAIPVMIDPDMTKVLIDSAKLSGTKKSTWANLDGSKLMNTLIGIIVIGIIGYCILSGGGL